MTELRIDGFELIENLGGGMAAVWKARQVSLDRIVAIKILPPGRVRTPDDVEMFQTEARTAAKLSYPGIVRVYDARVQNGLYYFVMEYVAGYTVGEWVRRKGVLSEADALVVADCVADALRYAWEKERLIHCDVKPDNVMVDADGTVKVADLGLARTMSSMAGEGYSEDVMGTPDYMSPEQALGMRDLDCRADIYSLGAVLYHLVTGKMMFEGQSERRIMDCQVSETPTPPRTLNPGLSKGVCLLIDGLLEKDRDARHAGWIAVRADIARVRKGALPRETPRLARVAARDNARRQARVRNLLDRR